MGFIDDIKNEDITLFEFVNTQIHEISEKLKDVGNIFTEYTDHSQSHSEQVLLNGERLSCKELNIYEKAIFVLSAYFHDIGMNVPQDTIIEYLTSLGVHPNIDYFLSNITETQQLYDINTEEKKKFIALNHFREKHSYLSADYILNNYPKNDSSNFVNGKYLWEQVAKICKAHTFSAESIKKDQNYSIDGYIENGIKINSLYLSLLLRLSDICHFSRDRAFPYILKNKDFLSKKSKNIWETYSSVVATIPDDESNTIRIQADCENVHQHRAIINESNYINAELLNCHKLLASRKSKYEFKWKFVDTSLVRPSHTSSYHYNDFKFNLNNSKIVDLLMGDKLYSNRLYAIRECIQNSIDSIKVISTKVRSEHYIYLNYKDAESPILEVYDSGTGMNLEIISENFLSVGSNSFWKTEKGIKEWNIDCNKIDLIADHGIGALSYFMIAKNVEIFTKYQKGSELIHLLIDNFKDSIISKKTKESDFPRFSSVDFLPNPWDLMHGTCIRFILKDKISFLVLIEFVAVNILRIPANLYLNYNDIEYSLKDIWHFRSIYDSHTLPPADNLYFYDEYSKKQKIKLSQSELIENLYTEKYDFYGDHPPKDIAVTNNEVIEEGINGKIHLNYWDEPYSPCRISQNGILIKNAFNYIVANKQSILLINAYGFDIDLSGKMLLQLDAERTTIIDNEYNFEKFQIIEDLFERAYFLQVSKIESSIYFRCGGDFYHGITDILFEHNDSLKCFNKNFQRIQNENGFANNSIDLKSFDSARIYMSGLERCSPISVDEIKKLQKRCLLLPKGNRLSSNGLLRTFHGEKYVDLGKLIKKLDIELNEQTIYVSDNEGPFLEPLYRNFNFSLIKENRFVYLIELQDGITGEDNKLRNILDKMRNL